MILHQLILRHAVHKDDAGFYSLQATDAIRWIREGGTPLKPGARVLDLGCGHGVFGAEFVKLGCEVTFSDTDNYLYPQLKGNRFIPFDLDRDDLGKLGTYDLVVCSNVFEHLPRPYHFLGDAAQLLAPGGRLFLSWTNWLSPWGGHEFSPFHYLGPRLGHTVYDRLIGKPRKHTPFENVFPTYIGTTLKFLRAHDRLRIVRAAPRYYTELSFLMAVPGVREFLSWNCALLIESRGPR